MNAPVEIIKTAFLEAAHHRFAWDPAREAQLLSTYRTLTPEQAHDLALFALEAFDARPHPQDDQARNLLKDLAIFMPGCLHAIYPELIKRGIFYPGEMYLGADAQTRDRLIAMIDESREHDFLLHSVLACLAWIGDDVALASFRRWRAAPPAWWQQLPFHWWQTVPYQPPTLERCAKEAGWELTREGGRRELFVQGWRQLVPIETAQVQEDSGSVMAGMQYGEHCAWCGRPLAWLFDLDLGNPALAFLGMPGKRLHIPACEWCGLSATTYAEVDFSGGSHWSQVNGPKPAHIDDRPDAYGPGWKEQRFRVSPLSANPYEPLTSHTGLNPSRLGGLPRWIQAADYPPCPECQRTMRFIGQLETSAIVRWHPEGITYAFVCIECGKAATVYQQT